MKSDKLGDSYDIVKRALLCWLRPFGAWSVHPMLTDDVPVRDYEKLIGARVISRVALDNDRDGFLMAAGSCRGNLFLDPDKGLSLGRGSREHVSINEFCDVVLQRPKDVLTVVFDQAITHGLPERRKLVVLDKLARIREGGVHAFAYFSHACFIVGSAKRTLVERARAHMIKESDLPP